MAALKVGMRVRVVGKYEPSSVNVGDEGVIVGEYIRDHDGYRYDWEVSIHGVDGWIFPSEQLAPLTDPGAESFIARIKKLGSEPVNDAPKVTVREGK